MLRRIYVELRDDSNRRIEGFTIFAPSNSLNPTFTLAQDYEYQAYFDDGRGNGDHMGSEFAARSLEGVMSKLAERITRENL